MKKDLFIKILKYIGVACLGAFIGMGALIGVSSCSQQHKENTQINKRDKVTNRSNFNPNKTYLFVGKNYDTLGVGSWINIAEGNLLDSYIYPDNESFRGNPNMRAEFDIINQQNYSRNALYFTFYQDFDDELYQPNTYGWRLSSSFMVNVDSRNVSSDSVYLYWANMTTYQYLRANMSFIGKNFSSWNDVFLTAVFDLFDLYELSNTSYLFSDRINPYNRWNADLDTPYVTMVSGYYPYLQINLPWFYSNGLAFDSIRLYYVDAFNSSFIFLNGNDGFNTNNLHSGEFQTFSYCAYYNSVTQFEAKVFEQQITYGSYYDHNSAFVIGSTYWNSADFKNLVFFQTPNTIDKLNLDHLNYYNGVSGISEGSSIGLGNVFTLLSQAFTAWLPILSVQIIPGISIGLLLFMPLVVGIIILVIWIVKR